MTSGKTEVSEENIKKAAEKGVELFG